MGWSVIAALALGCGAAPGPEASTYPAGAGPTTARVLVLGEPIGPLRGPRVADPPVYGPRGVLVAQDWGFVDAPTGVGAGAYRAIYLQESMYTLIPEIRAANPDALLLAYQKVGGMRADGGDHPSTGVLIGDAPEHWFLHDADGARLYYCDYPDVAAANVGDPDYQAAWLDAVRARLARDGFDGAMMDDVNTFPGHCLGARGVPIAEYPSDEAYGDAVVAFMAAVGPELKADGFAVAPNVAMNPWDDVMRAQALAMVPHVTHFVREYWMRWDDSENFSGDEWATTLSLMQEVEAGGVGFLALTYGPGVEGGVIGQRYGRASWLLAWDGVADSGWGYWDDALEPYGPDWGPPVGRPTWPAEPVGVGFLRRYSDGVVVVNPDPAASQRFGLGRPYLHPDGGTVDEVTIGPAQGLVLARP
jgi:hypothetical protein